MKKFLLLSFLFFLPIISPAQVGQRYYTALHVPTGGGGYPTVIPSASVYVCQYNTQLSCTTPVVIYSDEALTHPIAQPLIADPVTGVYYYYVQSQTYVVEKVCAPYNQCTSYPVLISGSTGGGGGSPSSPAFSVQFANTTSTAFSSDPNITINPATHNLAAYSLQGELNAALFGSPAAAIAIACATGQNAVYFPAGVYTSGLPLSCSGLHIRCASGSITGVAGTIFRITGSNWGLYNPTADVTSPGSGVNNITVDNCGFDISTDPTNVLGAWRIKGIGWSHFNNNSITTNNNTNPAVTEDGSNYAFNNGNYNNTFVGTVIYNKGSFPYSGAGYLLTGSGGSNNNTHVGGSVERFSPAVDIESGDNNSFIGIDGENWYQTGIKLAAGATGNLFSRFRTEAGLTPWVASASKSLGQLIVDSNGNEEIITTAGTTGSSVPSWSAGNVNAMWNLSGCLVVGVPGETVLLSSFNKSSTATATATLVATNTLSGATAVITSAGTGATSTPTSATCSGGTVDSVSGTASFTSSVGTAGGTTNDGGAVWTILDVLPVDVMATGSNSNDIDVYISGYETGVIDDNTKNVYSHPALFGCTACGNAFTNTIFSSNVFQARVGINKTPSLADAYPYGALDVHGEIQSDLSYLLCGSGGCGLGYNKLLSPASSGAVTNTLPGVTGSILGTNETLPITPACSSTLGSPCESNQFQIYGQYTTDALGYAVYLSGITATGAEGDTCSIGSFNNGSSGTATVTLTGTNTVASNTVMTIVSGGSGASAPPTTAVASNGTATCSGTVSVLSFLQANNVGILHFAAPGSGLTPNVAEIEQPFGPASAYIHEFNKVNLFVYNSVVATSLANSPAPYEEFYGEYFNSAPHPDFWNLAQTFSGSGASTTSEMIWTHSGATTSDVQVPNINVPGYYIGPTTAPTGACAVNGAWEFSQDGHATFCASGTWSTETSGVSSINSTAGAFTFSFSSGAGSCSGTTCTFTGSGSGGGSVTNFIASSGSWPTWLVPSVATSTTTPTLSVSASAIPNSALANVSTTVNGQTCTLGSSCTISGTQTLCSGTITLTGGTPIASGAETSAFTATCTGLATTDNISLDFNGDPTGITGFIPSSNGMLTILKFPASNTIEVYEINNTAASITPGTVVLNFHVYR